MYPPPPTILASPGHRLLHSAITLRAIHTYNQAVPFKDSAGPSSQGCLCLQYASSSAGGDASDGQSYILFFLSASTISRLQTWRRLLWSAHMQKQGLAEGDCSSASHQRCSSETLYVPVAHSPGFLEPLSRFLQYSTATYPRSFKSRGLPSENKSYANVCLSQTFTLSARLKPSAVWPARINSI